ncbi:TetR/AcrR family transcriptional regulator [Clostridium estertheticum]|uniref:TetR/AcrR family transcriptional regulator n=1 Tax=Clostridium estertheticum TaxID=238834 RepID=UPI001C0AF055|nr:TetR/AcrR family transcriptional regulator [Clostridium estertheticum]MBU3198389.1 TetR/AcrR family transcriptional regulator [Clostridium estertheticum]WAG65072.1 TetR/AcrR family transcriptional regulator [Clostridium estertheticum]
METRNKDLRIQKTEKSIRNALYQMVNEKKYTDISVTELSKRAEIGRKTFYLHYDSIESVFNEIRDELVYELRNLLDNKAYINNRFDINVLFISLNKTMENHLDFYKRIVNANSYAFFLNDFVDSFKNIMREQLRKSDINHPLENMYIEFFSTGLLSIYIKWLKGEIPLTLESITKFAEEAVNNGIKNLIIN